MNYVKKNNCYPAYLAGLVSIYFDPRKIRAVFIIKKDDKPVAAVGRSLNPIMMPKWLNYNKNMTPFSCGTSDTAVVVEDCCGSCGTNSKEDIPPQGSPQEGTLEGHNMKNRDYFKEGKENFVLVHLSNEDSPRQFPQCCVKRKSDVE